MPRKRQKIKRNKSVEEEERIRKAVLDNSMLEKPLGLRQLAEELGASKSTVDRIKKKYNIVNVLSMEPKKPKPGKRYYENKKAINTYVSDRTRAKAREFSEQIIDAHISTLESIHYAVEETRTINEKMKEMADSVPEQLRELLNYLDNGIGDEIFSTTEEQIKAKTAIFQAVAAVTALVPTNTVRLKAINELGNWIDRFEKYEAGKIAIKTMELQLEALFKGLTILDEDDYQKVKGYIIGTAPESVRLFDKFETVQPTEYEVVKDGEQQ